MSQKPTIKVTALNFTNFRSSSRICILKAQVGESLGFGQFSKLQFERDYPNQVNFGHINIGRTGYRARTIQDFIKIDMPQIGLRTNSILPGYYLFKDGVLKAFHPGTFEPDKVDTTVTGVAALSGAIAGLIVGIFERSAAKGFEVFLEAMEMPVALKVSQFFKEILSDNSSSHFHQRQQTVYNEEILNAYKLLQVFPNAADVDVAKAWKKLVRENHPDKFPDDAEAKNKYCAELNNAYDLIKKYRAANN